MTKTTIGKLTLKTDVYDSTEIDSMAEDIMFEISSTSEDIKMEISGVSADIDKNIVCAISKSLGDLEINGFYISLAGNEATNATWNSTQRIRNAGKPIVYENAWGIYNTMCVVAAYDKDGKFLKSKSVYREDSGQSGKAFNESGTFEFDDEVEFISIGVKNGDTSTKVTWYENEYPSEVFEKLNDNLLSIGLIVDEALSIANTHALQISAANDEISAIQQHLKVVRPVDYDVMQFDFGYINSSGGWTPRSDIQTTEPIYNLGQPIQFTNAWGANNNTYAIAAYDKDGKFLSSKSVKFYDPSAGSGGAVISSGTYEFDASVAYARVSFSKNKAGNALSCINYIYISTIYPKEISSIINTQETDYAVLSDAIEHGALSEWNGKKWVAYGTSITYGEYGLYPAYLVEKSGLVLTNRGIGGGTFSLSSETDADPHGRAEILTRILADASNGLLDDADLVTVEGVINDWNYGRPLGEIDEEIPADISANLPTTICGGMRAALKTILTHSKATVVVLTDNSGAASYPTTKKNRIGKYQREYNDKIIEVAKFMGVNWIDVAGKSQINEYHPEYIANSVHHTPLGGKQYAATIWDELRSIHCNSTLSVAS